MDIKNFQVGELSWADGVYGEVRLHENRNLWIRMVNGDVVQNTRRSGGGISARVYREGQWGFASEPELSREAVDRVLEMAERNASFLASRQGDASKALPPSKASLGVDFTSDKEPATQAQMLSFLKTLDAWMAQRFEGLKSRTLRLSLEDMERRLVTSTGSEGHSMTPRSILYVTVVAEDGQGQPVELSEIFSQRGQFQDVFEDPAALHGQIEALVEHLEAKRQAVAPRAGLCDVILAPAMTGILAHEAIGHPTEADLVLGGSVAGDMLGQKVASELISMIDFAHTYNGETLPVPVHMDDEGVESKDAVLIEDGVLKGFMHNRDTARHFGVESTGSARAFKFDDEPLIRMRNTAILPGNDKLEEMIASIDDGYLLIKTRNGQADTTSEFMFGVSLGYEIKNGKVGRAIKDTTISGVAFDVLKTVTAVSDEMEWECSGYCGKKQLMPVGAGGPSIKCRVHMGGQ